MAGDSWRRWLVKIITRGALGKHSAVPLAVVDVLVHDIDPPHDDDPDPPSGGPGPPNTPPDQPPGNGVRVAMRENFTEYEMPAAGLSFPCGRSSMAHEDGQWAPR